MKIDDLLSRIDEREQHLSLVDSASSDGWAPTVAWDPVAVLQLTDDDMNDAIERIESFVHEQQNQGRLVIGYMSYDFGAKLHDVTLSIDDDLKTSLLLLYSFEDWIVFDDITPTFHDTSGTLMQSVTAIMGRRTRSGQTPLYTKQLSPVMTRDQYASAYQSVKSYITAGDVYQVNLTHRLHGIARASGLDIYRRTAQDSQANYRSYIRGDDGDVISMSPERFVRIKRGVIETSPIKGTRARGVTPAEDDELRDDLLANEKDTAELNMITDLMRNDLGEVCEVGSVKVINERVLIAYPTLWHAHSTIRGNLLASMSPIRALTTLLPGGSITGCPKKRAIEIIDKLEMTRRGVYTGSIFVIQPDGTLDSSIAIRTMIKKENDVYVSVGGGIVYDSDEQAEYDESLQKAAVFTVHT